MSSKLYNKVVSLLIAMILTGVFSANAFAQTKSDSKQINFDDYFLNKTMRFDFYHSGDSQNQEYFFDELKEEPYWAGSKVSLIDNTGYGVQMFKIIDKASGKEIYSRSYCTLFNEWQTTPEADEVQKAMPEAVVFPFPKNKVIIEFYARKVSTGKFEKKYQQEIDPNSYFIKQFSPQYETFDVVYNGNPSRKVDIVLISEGYTEDEKEKFMEACEVFGQEMFSYSPYKENAHKFNIRAVWAPSAESGVTIPGEYYWRNTALDARYYTFDSERYQMIEDFQRVRDISAHVPYELIYILSNTKKYGGGGIYNFYGISAAHHPNRTGRIYIHEFGHLLLGLGDEYVEVGSSFNEMYPFDVEPWEENLTTLVDFDKKEWKRMLDKNTPIPTPLSGDWQKKLDKTAIDATPKTESSALTLGVYEGGGYVTKGVYRPWPNCLMNNLHTIDKFCPVCTYAIQKQIDFLCR